MKWAWGGGWRLPAFLCQTTSSPGFCPISRAHFRDRKTLRKRVHHKGPPLKHLQYLHEGIHRSEQLLVQINVKSRQCARKCTLPQSTFINTNVVCTAMVILQCTGNFTQLVECNARPVAAIDILPAQASSATMTHRWRTQCPPGKAQSPAFRSCGRDRGNVNANLLRSTECGDTMLVAVPARFLNRCLSLARLSIMGPFTSRDSSLTA